MEKDKKEISNPNTKNEEGQNALMIACKKDSELSLIKELIKKTENLDLKDNEGQTAIIIATTKNNKKIIECLIEEKCNLNIKDNSGKTALEISALENYNPEILEVLLKMDLTSI